MICHFEHVEVLRTMPEAKQADQKPEGGPFAPFRPRVSSRSEILPWINPGPPRTCRDLSVMTHSPRPWCKYAPETHEGATRR